MCGIAGFVNFSPHFEPRQLLAVSKTLRHRGPDDEGFLFLRNSNESIEVFSDEFAKPDFLANPISIYSLGNEPFKLGFLHRRLSIIAPDSQGHQPMPDEERKFWLIFNGEIYNYLALKKELKQLGCVFKTRTDTEVLLMAYKIWGENCLAKLDGMWAFAIFDLEKNIIFAASDRSGIKPFYFHKDKNGFCFASEIKAFKDFGIQFEENPQTVSRYLAFGQADENEQTMFQNIFRLQAGQFLKLDLKTEAFKIETYHQWEWNSTYDFQPHFKENECIQNIRTALLEMIRLRLQADVPLGICVSGGIDSSTIAGLTAATDRISKNKGIRKAFMAVLPSGSAQDESTWARMMAKKCGFEFFASEANANDFLQSFRELIYTQDEPSPGLNVFSQYEVFRNVARQGVRVTLDGQGADEIFAGYPRHQESNLFEGLLHGIFPEDATNYLKEGGINFMRHHFKNRSAQFLQKFKPEYSILNSNIFETSGGKGNFYTAVNQGLINEFSSSSLPFLLKAADRNSMRWSVESRMPFADYSPLIQMLFDIPGSAKIQKGYTKYLLRRAAEPFVPQAILNRRDKVGFAAPNVEWLSALVKSRAMNPSFKESEYIDFKKFETYKNLFLSSPQSIDFQLIWRILAYSEWKDIFIH